MLGNGRPSGTGIGEKGDTDRGLLPLTDQQFRHRRKLHNGFKVLIIVRFTHISPKHLHRYVNEFAGRHNLRPQDTERTMQEIYASLIGKRLTI